jgi:hypothetical protein
MKHTDSIPNAGNPHTGAGAAFDLEAVVTKLESEEEARLLPPGSVIGDVCGGLTFTDAIAAILEARSLGGWQEVAADSGQTWTIIVLNR